MEELVDRILDGMQIILYPRFKFAACNGYAKVHAAVTKMELRTMTARQLELQPLNGPVELIPEVFFDQSNQGLNFIRLKPPNPRTLQDFPNLIGAEEGEIVPPLEVGKDPGWNRRKEFIERSSLRVRSQCRRDKFANDSCVKGVSGEPYSAIAQKILRSSSAAAHTRTDTQQTRNRSFRRRSRQ